MKSVIILKMNIKIPLSIFELDKQNKNSSRLINSVFLKVNEICFVYFLSLLLIVY